MDQLLTLDQAERIRLETIDALNTLIEEMVGMQLNLNMAQEVMGRLKGQLVEVEKVIEGLRTEGRGL